VQIDLNADVGESFGAYTIGDDGGVMRSVTSASVAAGFHGGDPSVLRRTIRLARDHGVAVGAHPSFPDRDGFGRREMRVADADLEDLVLYQIAAVAGVARAEGVQLRHVKPHGALYNMAARDPRTADRVVAAVAAFDGSLVVCAPPSSALARSADAAGLQVAREGFADRAYRPDGSLVPRDQPGAVIATVEQVVTRAIQMVLERTVETIEGSRMPIEIDTICVHGDTPGAGALAAWLRAGLQSAGVELRAPASGARGRP
jgi:UPF0271 protein